MLARAHSVRHLSASNRGRADVDGRGCQATRTLPWHHKFKRSLRHENGNSAFRGLATHACANKGESQAPQAVDMPCCIRGQPAARLRKVYPKRLAKWSAWVVRKLKTTQTLAVFLQATGLQECQHTHHRTQYLHCKMNSCLCTAGNTKPAATERGTP